MKHYWIYSVFCVVAGFTLAGCVTTSHVYLTWQGDPATTMTVNFHTQNEAISEVRYDAESRGGALETYAHTARGDARQIPGMPGDRWVHTVELTGLTPGSDYYFSIPGDGNPPRERKFRTLPTDGSPIRFIDGGDVGVVPGVLRLFRRCAEREPHFVSLGGDIAYENGNVSRDSYYDLWLRNWEEGMVTPTGYTIPLMAAIGNHETNGEHEDPILNAPFYFGYFPQGGSSNFIRQIGPYAVLLFLDSGHTQTWESQVPWLRDTLASHADVPFTLVTYHVPLYPSHRDYAGSGSVAGRTHWLPVFDEFGVDIAFEHHDHTYKRTKPLRGGAVDPGGTVYIGDGCFGMPARTVQNDNAWYMEAAASVRHFWYVEVGASGVRMEAVDINGDVFDELDITP